MKKISKLIYIYILILASCNSTGKYLKQKKIVNIFTETTSSYEKFKTYNEFKETLDHISNNFVQLSKLEDNTFNYKITTKELINIKNYPKYAEIEKFIKAFKQLFDSNKTKVSTKEDGNINDTWLS